MPSTISGASIDVDTGNDAQTLSNSILSSRYGAHDAEQHVSLGLDLGLGLGIGFHLGQNQFA
jgi:hypothetical protein